MVLGGVIILWIIGFLMQFIDTMLWQPIPLGGGGGLSKEQVWIFDLVWTLFSVVLAVLYVRYPIPRNLRKSQP